MGDSPRGWKGASTVTLPAFFAVFAACKYWLFAERKTVARMAAADAWWRTSPKPSSVSLHAKPCRSTSSLS